MPGSGSLAFNAAKRAASTRLIWPAPTPTVCTALAYTMALDLTCLTTVQARSSAFHSSSVGLRLLMTSHLARSSRCRSHSCARTPPMTRRRSKPATRWMPVVSMSITRRFFFAASVFLASPSRPGAISASTKTDAIFWDVGPSTRRFRATIPPKADRGSHSQARS